jgi:hypothetical protein
MRSTSSPSRKVFGLILAFAFTGVASDALATDTWVAGSNPLAGTLTIASLAIGNAIYTNVVLDNVGPANVVQFAGGALPGGAVDTYDPATKHLTILAVTLNSAATVYNAVVTLNPISGEPAITVSSIDSVTGADVYLGGGLVYIPSVQVVGGGLYSDVTVSATANDIQYPPPANFGQLPAATRDSYNASTQQLTIAAILYDGIVVTNAILNNIALPDVRSIGSGSSVPAVYAIDANGTLFAFDANGRTLASASITTVNGFGNTGISNLLGGGITTDAKYVYVTSSPIADLSCPVCYGTKGNVLAFDKVTLAFVNSVVPAIPENLPYSTKLYMTTPRGIAYDSVNSQFYIADGAGTLNIYGAQFNYLSAVINQQGAYGPSGVAFDPIDGTIWVANDTNGSGVNPIYGVAEFTGAGAHAQPLNPASLFQAPTLPTTVLPYSIGYCASPARSGTAYVVVGYLGDNSGNGIDEGGIFTTGGESVAPFSPPLGITAQPNAISCSSTGQVYVAANDGLHIYSATANPGVSVIGGEEPMPAKGFQGMVPPIYGVYAAY